MSRDEVLELVVARIRVVLGAGAEVALGRAGTPWRQVRFDEDLHADSLDLVEIVEGAERELRRRGVAVEVGDVDLAGVRAVGDAVDALVGRTCGQAQEPRP